MGWKMAPGRFLKPGRAWIPQWRFQPLQKLEDALELMDQAADSFVLKSSRGNEFIAEVQIGRRRGTASGQKKARTLTIAVARALGIDL